MRCRSFSFVSVVWFAAALAGCAREGSRWAQGPTAADDQFHLSDDAGSDLSADVSDLLAELQTPDVGPTDTGLTDSVLPDGDVQPLDLELDTPLPPDTGDVTVDAMDVSDAEEVEDTMEELLPDIESDVVNAWQDVEIISANAPDDTHVVIVFSAAPQQEMGQGQFVAKLDSDRGSVAVTGVEWDATSFTLTLTTMKQKLGVTYTVALGSLGATSGLLQADFLAADTKVFWATDFDDPAMDDIQVGSHRIYVGQNTVAYCMDGYDFEGAADAAAEFDALIYPTLTQALLSPMDFDGNGRVVLLFTDSDDYGGYFSPVNQFTSFYATMYGAHSNEMEILYISGWSGTGYFGQVEAHEFQHLLYYCRHLMKDNVHWDFHDEGLAESAVAIVYGTNLMAALYYQADPQQLISMGLSLVDWEWGLYENYALAYVFWAWVAGQLGGPEGYALLFDIDYGGPEEVSAFLQEHLGMDLHQALFHMMAAVRIQAESGLHSFNGMLTLEPAAGPMVPTGTSEVTLEPFGGVFFHTASSETPEPAGHGEHVVFGGVTSSGEYDTEAPFDTTGGWLVAYNQNWNYHSWHTESTGAPSVSNPAPALAKSAASWRPYSPAWDSPPPRNPLRPEQWQNWRNRGAHTL